MATAVAFEKGTGGSGKGLPTEIYGGTTVAGCTIAGDFLYVIIPLCNTGWMGVYRWACGETVGLCWVRF